MRDAIGPSLGELEESSPLYAQGIEVREQLAPRCMNCIPASAALCDARRITHTLARIGVVGVALVGGWICSGRREERWATMGRACRVACGLAATWATASGLRSYLGRSPMFTALRHRRAAEGEAQAFFRRWHATDIAWPPLTDLEGAPSQARATTEENKSWLTGMGLHVYEDVDVFDVVPYLRARQVRPEEVLLCVYNCAHGRNYRRDATARYALMGEWHWSSFTFRSAAFQAMCAQLPNATCILTSRHWEPVTTQLSNRPILHSAVCYSPQSGPPYKPEPSTRSSRREGELGLVEELAATVAVGPLLECHFTKQMSIKVDIPELAFIAASSGGAVLFLGEFTLASARHCAQFACEQISQGRPLQWAVSRRNLPVEQRRHWRGHSLYSYADCVQHARDQEEAHAALLAAHIWMGMASTPAAA